MALDTAAKRASAMGVGCPWLPLVQPNASKPEAWRASASFVYGGNVLIAVDGSPVDGWDSPIRTRQWQVASEIHFWDAPFNGHQWEAPE